MKNYIIVSLILLSAVIFMGGCKKEFRNPNNPTAPDILETREGLITLSVGMKQNYATSALEGLYINSGVTSREMRGTSTLQNVLDYILTTPSLSETCATYIRDNILLDDKDEHIAITVFGCIIISVLSLLCFKKQCKGCRECSFETDESERNCCCTFW